MALLIYLYPALLIVFLAINTQQVKAIVLLFKHAPTDNIIIQIQQPVLTAHLVLHIVQFVWILMCVQNVIVMNLFLPMEGFNFTFLLFFRCFANCSKGSYANPNSTASEFCLPCMDYCSSCSTGTTCNECQ